VGADDKAQQLPGGCAKKARKRSRAWMRWIGIAPRDGERERASAAPPGEQVSLHATLRALPAQLDGSGLPNGVVELLIDDFEAPTRQLFDIHDGRIALVEPGTAVPWASISGTATAWTQALGPGHDTTELRLTGDEQLARHVLGALPAHDRQSRHGAGERS
jgi:hypothetical protein